MSRVACHDLGSPAACAPPGVSQLRADRVRLSGAASPPHLGLVGKWRCHQQRPGVTEHSREQARRAAARAEHGRELPQERPAARLRPSARPAPRLPASRHPAEMPASPTCRGSVSYWTEICQTGRCPAFFAARRQRLVGGLRARAGSGPGISLRSPRPAQDRCGPCAVTWGRSARSAGLGCRARRRLIVRNEG
jgi:hypothetical protein